MSKESKMSQSQETELKFLMEEYAAAFSDQITGAESSPSSVNELIHETNQAQQAVVDFVNSLIWHSE